MPDIRKVNSELNIKLEEVLKVLPLSLQKKVMYSVELLRKAEKLALAYNATDGYYLAFSGGKDSQCLYHVARLSGVRFKAHMSLTSIDPPEVIRFVKHEYPDVELIKPRDSIFNIAVQKHILPTMRVRWCCAEYKEGSGAGNVTLIGIRHAESSRRAKRNEVEVSNRSFSGTLDGLDDFRKNRASKRGKKTEVTIVNADGERTLGCIRGKESLLISPIIKWTDNDVWTFLNTLKIRHCELYDQGWHRIGCILCPMASPKQKQLENERWPHAKRNWIKAIKAIRNGGGVSRKDTDGTSAAQTHQGGGNHRKPEPKIYHQQELVANSGSIPTKRTSGERVFADGYIWWNIPSGLTPHTLQECREQAAQSQEYPQQPKNASTGDFGRVFRLLHAWPLDGGAREQNSGEHLRLVDKRQSLQAMVRRKIPTTKDFI